MIWFTKWSFRNKSAVFITSALILILGIVSYRLLPMELLPYSDNPNISVIVIGQGYDADTLNQSVTQPMEKALIGIRGKKETFSESGSGYVKMDLMFDSDTDMRQAKTDVQEALQAVELPPNTSKPYITLLNTAMISIANVSVTFPDGITKHNLSLVEEQILPEFQSIEGVSSVTTYGKIDQPITVELDQAAMERSNIPVTAVLTALQGQNAGLAVGSSLVDNKNSSITVIGHIEGLDELKRLPVSGDVQLSELASVEYKSTEGNLTRINGEDAVIMIITKEAQANAVSLSEMVREKAVELDEQFVDARIGVYFSTGDMVKTSVNSMLLEVLVGAFFATLVILFFLRNLKTTVITVVSIPMSLGLTLFLLYQSGITLNILTLGGVAVSVGRLVDDSIVVVENIYRRMQKDGVTSHIVDATKEVTAAITSSTLTTVAVFLPIGLVGGGLQSFLLPIALTVTYSLLSSLLVALTVVPLLSARMLRNAKMPKHKAPKRYVSLLKWSLNTKWLVLTMTLLLFATSVGLYLSTPQGIIDNSEAEFVMASLEYPTETSPALVAEKAMELEKQLIQQDDIDFIYTQMGNSSGGAEWGLVGSPTIANLTLKMKKDVNAEPVIQAIEAQKSNYPEATLTVGSGTMTGSSNAAITIDVVGANSDPDTLSELANQILQSIEGIEGVTEASSNEQDKQQISSLIVDPARANTQEVAQQLSILFNRIPLGTVTENDRPTPVYLEPLMPSATTAELNQLMIQTSQGVVPASSIGEWKNELKTGRILEKDGKSYLRVIATIEPSMVSLVSADIQKAIFGSGSQPGLNIEDGIDVIIGGASSQQANDFSDIFLTMLVSIGVVYLILVVTFKSVRTPLVILCTLPLAAIGAILGIIVSGASVDVTSLLGGLLLIGIVVTNAIVLIDKIKQNEQTMMIREAITEAAAIRLRPILMTAMATILAMMPLLFRTSESGSLVSSGLATVVISGLLVATLMTLFVVPVIYELFYFRKSKHQIRTGSHAKSTSSAGQIEM